MKNNICIVVIAYNRPTSLNRCLNRINECTYDTKVDLFISIDDSQKNLKTLAVANNFDWKYGNKTVISNNIRLGLKEHVLKCGNIVNEYSYDGIIMLEDDIYVARDFFSFTAQCLEQYDSCLDIAGISLYNHSWNINAKLPFIPIYDGYDVYFLQYAQSWGQAWTTRMWNDFLEWYNTNKEWDFNDRDVPQNVLKWPESSWLKYFIKYCCKLNKYFVYPHHSQSTNYSDVGTHNSNSSKAMQRPLSICVNKRYNLPNLSESKALYDCFFENIMLKDYLSYSDLTIDLYNQKKSNTRYLLTTARLDFKIIKKFAMELKPIELNIFNDIVGDEIFLYDTSLTETHDFSFNSDQLLSYYWQDYDLLKSLNIIINRIIGRLKNKLKR